MELDLIRFGLGFQFCGIRGLGFVDLASMEFEFCSGLLVCKATANFTTCNLDSVALI